MAYSTNPNLPRLRAKACEMIRQGKTVSEVARYFGYSKGAVSKWYKRYPPAGAWSVPTLSSRPKHHPKELSSQMVDTIIAYKERYNRCSEVTHAYLKQEGVEVSLSSVKRTLDRAGLTKKKSPWKKLHLSVERPKVAFPGDLVMVDTIHLMVSHRKRIYVYTLIDVYSRWTYAWAVDRISAKKSIEFLKRAQREASFTFRCIQSDHGPEFSQHFTERIKILHRHSRVRKPNDNSYVERFNRTLQEECLDKVPVSVRVFNRTLAPYLLYYNTERLHMGIGFQVPMALLG